MQVIIDGDALRPPRSGVGVYTLELLTRLCRHPSLATLAVLLGTRTFSFEEALALAEAEDAPRAPSPLGKMRAGLRAAPGVGPVFGRLAAGLRGLRGQTGRTNPLAKLTKAERFIFHAPNFIPPFSAPNLVLTVHDVSFIRHPETHPEERLEWLREGLEGSARQASSILVPSAFTRREFLEHFDWFDETRVRVTPLGVSPEFRPREGEETDAILARYGLSHRSYCLFSGNLEPRKNLHTLLKAWKTMPRELTRAFPLALVGADGWNNTDLLREIAELEKEEIVRKLGFVPASDLPMIAAGARACAFISLYEGFGLPVLESMASGVPVLTSRAASLPEVAGDAALLVDPLDVEAVSYNLMRLLEDDDIAAHLRERGIERARAFSWEKCVDTTVSVYQAVATNG